MWISYFFFNSVARIYKKKIDAHLKDIKKINNLTLQFPARNIGIIWRNITDLSCKKHNILVHSIIFILLI